jgi:hypothetical protein
MKLLLSHSLDWSSALAQLREALLGSGLQVTNSFDLQTARATLVDPSCCPCPYHGTPDCTCQYVVLLVSLGDAPPISVVIHGYDNSTFISLIHSETEARDEELAELIIATIRTLPLKSDHPPN